MFGLIKLAPAPVVMVTALLDSVLPNAGNVLGFSGIAVIIGGCFVVGYYKAAADKAEKLLSLQAQEVQILANRSDRLEKENAVLLARPNLDQHAKLLERLIERADQQTEVLHQIYSAVVPPF